MTNQHNHTALPLVDLHSTIKRAEDMAARDNQAMKVMRSKRGFLHVLPASENPPLGWSEVQYVLPPIPSFLIRAKPDRKEQ